MLIRLTDSDLRFLLETVATRRTDHERVIELVRKKEDFLEQMLDDPKLLDRLLNDEEVPITRSSVKRSFIIFLSWLFLHCTPHFGVNNTAR